MPKLLAHEKAPVDRATVLCADPDERGRGWITDGLVMNGRDPFAERRRQMRELHDGRPDPVVIDPVVIDPVVIEPIVKRVVEARAIVSRVMKKEGAPMPVGVYERKPRMIGEDGVEVKPHRKSEPAEVRKEIYYCAHCQRQLGDDEVDTEHENVVMTTYGGITSTIVTCQAHPTVPIARATYFVIKAGKG